MRRTNLQPGSPSPLGSSVSSTLLERLRVGDSDAWRRWATLFGPVIYHWCRRAGLQSSDAADVVQEVFAAVATNLQDFHRSNPGDTFTGWVRTVTRNKIRDHLRRQARHPMPRGGSSANERLQQFAQADDRPPASPDGSDIADLPPELEKSLLQRQAVELIQCDFSATTWQAFWRTAVDGQEAAVVAQELGLSKEAVRRAKFRVVKRLRQELAGMT